MAIKLRNEYGPVLHMPTSKENFKEKCPQNASDSYGHKQYPANQGKCGIIRNVILFRSRNVIFKNHLFLYKAV